jgi:hypothetical protein
MKRRRFIQTVATVPATGLIAQRTSSHTGEHDTPATTNSASEELPQLDSALPDSVASVVPRFFSALQLATLRKLAGVVMPASGTSPGAVEARAPEFLDFLISQSSVDRQHLYRNGLDELNAEAHRRFACSFTETQSAQADEILAPLRRTWSPHLSPDPIARFLIAAKADLRTATINSLEWSKATRLNGRESAPSGLYWFPFV